MKDALTVEEFKAICQWFYEAGEMEIGFEQSFEAFTIHGKINP